MKKLVIFLAFFLGMAINAQNQRFVYEYKFVSDSTKKDESKTELMFLDVAKKGSKFFSRNLFVSDSLLQVQNKGGNRDFSKIKFGMIGFKVEKSYPDYKVIFFNRLDMDEYKVYDERKLNWKILPDKEKIGEFNAQKAIADFAGRKWIAWFVSDIPIQDGPYKFHGLPGLIVKIEDETKSHSFVLKEIKNLKQNEEWISEEKKQRLGTLITLSQEKYKKQFLDNRNNPTKGIRQLMASGRKVMMTDENGKQMDVEEMLRNQERKVKEENAKNNNLLELDLLK
ncbi:GLPGLI family protein [Chryseobacterium wanjuense]|uniref:GLPGLI family protein n=1 Tax=Chryseobacterium wanjuense TaxID=356305 RepID=A0A1I0P8Q9_9FLAO|nr:GLPGLI family protein [Chryseobacterium wanjuense]SEW10737.1 GLPGLI family protein [Chryseobacterium wanjuense]